MRGITFLLIAMLCGHSSTATGTSVAKVEDTTDSFYVQGATLSDPRHQEFISAENAFSAYVEKVKNLPYPMVADFEWAGHRIGAGRGNILAIRWFTDFSASSNTDETFTKVTIWVPELPQEKGLTIELDVNEVTSFWSHDFSAFAGQRGCFGYGEEGSVSITRLNDMTLSIELNLQFDSTSLPHGSDTCRRFVLLKWVIVAKEKALADLTPFDGREGSHPYDETFR